MRLHVTLNRYLRNEVKVLARQDDWVKVQLNDGRDAWLRATQIHTI